MKNKNVTNLNTLKSYMKGNLVQLPSFGVGQEFYARLRRPSLLDMIKNDQIPNSLLNAASDLFAEGTSSFVTNREMTKELFDVIDVICDATFVEPTYQQIRDAGVKLTDEQLMFIFNYSQNGVKALESFREEPEDDVDTPDEQALLP